MSDTEIKEKEGLGPEAEQIDGGINPAEQAELDQIEAGLNDEGGLYKGSGKKSGRFSRRKKAISGGIAGLIVGGSLAGFSVLQGPLQVMHFSQLLQQFHFSNSIEFTNNRTYKFLKSFRSGTIGTAIAATRLGVLQDFVANKVELRLNERAGLKSIYHERTGRLIKYEIIDLDKAIDALGDLDFDTELDIIEPGQENSGTDIKGNKIDPKNGAIRVDNQGRFSYKVERKFTKALTKITNTNRVTQSVAARLLKKRAGIILHPFEFAKKGVEKLGDWRADKKKKRSEERGEGRSDNNRRVSGRGVDEDGNPIETESDVSNAGNEMIDGADGGDRSKLMSRLIKGGGIALAAAGAVCAINDVGESVDDFQQTNVILPMIRMGAEIISAGAQVQSGQDISLDSLGVLVSDLHSEEKGSWAAARSIQAELGEDQTGPDVPASAKPSADGKALIFKIVDKIPFVDQGCGAQDALGSVPIIGDAINLTSSLSEKGINTALGFFNYSIEQFYEAVISFFAGEAVDTFAQGSDLGNIANYGARLMANDQAIAMGGRKLQPQEVAQLDALSRSALQEEISSKSLFARLFDVSDANSLVASSIIRAPKSFNGLVEGVVSSPLSVASMLLPETHAQAEYDYGFNEYGFSFAEFNNPNYEDPIDNAAYVEPKLDELNDEYGECFNLTIETEGDTVSIVNGDSVAYSEIPDKCDNNNEDLIRYRFYIADVITGHSLACYEGRDSSCAEIGFDSGNNTTAGNGGSLSGPIVLNGKQLDEKQEKWVKYIFENILPKLSGTHEEKIKKAAAVTWWSLKEGVLNTQNPLSYSNCHFSSGDKRIEPTDVCAEKMAWQVGISGAQSNPGLRSRAEQKMSEVYPGKSDKEVLKAAAEAAVAAGMDSGLVQAITDSTGTLRGSWLLRDGPIGFESQYPVVLSECVNGNKNWCFGTGFDTTKQYAPDKQTALAVIAELEELFSGAGVASGSTIVGDPYSPGADIPCAAGTTDLGSSMGYSSGSPFSIRLCSLDNLKSIGQADNPGGGFSTNGANGHAIVNSRVSGAWYALIEAAKSAGVDLTAKSSFRSMEHQQALCNNNSGCRNGDSSLVATPGYSSHQAGVAIDFNGISGTGSSSSCSGRATDPSNPGWVWLRDNAVRYGLKQYSGESWHWDALPTANRC